jgi:hypothetical protein
MGRLMVVKRGTVPGRQGEPGPPGDTGPGGAPRSFYYPTDAAFGAVGDGVTDDQAALEACWEAAAATGGVVLIDRPYGFSDKIKHYGGMEVWQIRPRQILYVAPGTALADYPIEPGLIALEDTAWYQYGDGSDGSGSANDNPGPIRGLAIDGRGIAGGGDGLFVMDANQSSIYDLMVVYSAGHGLRTGRSQNVNLFNPQIGGCAGTGFKIKTLDGLDTQQGAGHILTFGGHIHDNYLGVDIDMGAGTFFPPHDNVFTKTLIESGRNADLGPVKCAVRANAGQTQFNDCNITFGVNATAHEDDCCILVDNSVTSGLGSVSTVVGYRGGSIGGGGDGMTDAIRIKQTLAANEVRIEGRIAWANVTYMFAVDGIDAGFCDPIITHTGQDVFITGGIKKMRAINAGTLLNGYRKQWQGNLFELPTGERSDGATLTNGDIPNPFVVKRADESVGRFSIDWSATQRWVKAAAPTTGNPAPVGTTLGTHVVVGDIWGTTGRWGIGGGFYRTCTVKSIATDQAVNLDWSTANYFLLSFTSGADATSITFTPAVTVAGGALADWVPSRGQHVLLGISALAAGSVITWPANITWATTAPQPVNGVLQFVELVYDTGTAKWFEKSRSHQTATTASGVTFTPTGTIAATDVQAAIAEVSGDVTANTTAITANATAISDHLADTTAAHAASAVSYAGSTNLAATDVEAALDELDTEKAATSVTTSYNTPQTNTTYDIPTGAKALEIFVQAAGAGGGSGRRGAAASVRCGGGGGSAGGRSHRMFPVSDLTGGDTATLYVTVGTGGAGGAAVTADSTDGNIGSSGTASVVRTATAASAAATVVNAQPGQPGAGGTATAGTGGTAVTNADFSTSAGASASTSGGTGGSAGATSGAAGSGGAGGGVTSGNSQSAGGAGGVAGGGYPTAPAGGTAGGGAGNPGNDQTILSSGSGGSGGGGNSAGVGGDGGVGGRGGGGGGGGASVNGSNSGKGGDGGNGYVKIIAWF